MFYIALSDTIAISLIGAGGIFLGTIIGPILQLIQSKLTMNIEMKREHRKLVNQLLNMFFPFMKIYLEV